MIDINEKTEYVILCGVSTDDGDDTEKSLDELKELADTAGAVTVAKVIQNREKVHPGTYIGKGKIEEVSELVARTGATGIICDDELSPAQMKNLSDALDIKVMDRTMLILDIFAQRASTSEGKIQVELAQLQYRSSRLIGTKNLSRLGGGIGTRGPGESKLEEDRRTIRDRISRLKKELENVKSNREITRAGRKRSAIPVVAIVGYTNAGKSTLLNKLTGAGVLEEDKLFATLDPTTRLYVTESGFNLMFTDTVGFIRKLPHHLVDAFRSTLEEAKYSDIILHVVDAANPECYNQMYVVYETLEKLGAGGKTVVTALNKQDIAEDADIKDLHAAKTVKISAKTGEGLDSLVDAIEEEIKNGRVQAEKLLDYKDAGLLGQIRKYGDLEAEEYREDGIFVRFNMPKERALSLGLLAKEEKPVY